MPPVLVIEDEQIIRDLLTEILAGAGHEVRSAANGAEALAIVGSWTPDLILLDLNMPQMDGWTFRAHQLSLDGIAHVPVVVLSATADLANAARALVPAATLRKPFDVEDILRIVTSVLPMEILEADVGASQRQDQSNGATESTSATNALDCQGDTRSMPGLA